MNSRGADVGSVYRGGICRHVSYFQLLEIRIEEVEPGDVVESGVDDGVGRESSKTFVHPGVIVAVKGDVVADVHVYDFVDQDVSDGFVYFRQMGVGDLPVGQ